MPVQVACPQCDVLLDVPESLLGKQVRCATCATVFEATAKDSLATEKTLRQSLPPASGFDQARDRDDFDREDDTSEIRRRMRRDLEPHRATTVLLLGVFSMVMPFTCGLPGTLIGMVVGIMAIFQGNRDLAKMRGGVMDPDGESQTRTGLILGYVGFAISVLMFLACGAYTVVVVSTTLFQGG